MAADSNMDFRHAPFHSRHMVSFGSGAASGGARGFGAGAAAGMFDRGAVSSTRAAPAAAGVSPGGGGVLLEPVPGLRRDTGLAAEWTLEEQARLQEGLARYAGEHGILKYIKIAAVLRDKTVRDVALRCRWMNKKEHGKRRKQEHYVGKKLKDRKEKMLDTYFNANVHTINSDNMASSSLMMSHLNHSDQLSCEAPALDGRIQKLMDGNFQIFSQIAANLATFKVQGSIDLFCRARSNITSILNSMSEMPGIMRLMPPLPISVDEQLLNSILPGTSQAFMFNTHGAMYMKQELGCL